MVSFSTSCYAESAIIEFDLNGMAFNPFNLFKGNPRVLELMAGDRPLDQLLLEEAFVSEFKKTENEALQAYMNYERYAELITYITAIDPTTTDKNRAFKFPYVASEVLAVNNELTYKFLLEEVVFTEEQVEEEVEVEKELDSGSDRSHSSIKSNNSVNSTNSPARKDPLPFSEAEKENFVLREEGDKTLSELDLREITEDDFPEVKQRRVIMVRERVVRTVKRPYEPLILRLLRYFSMEVVHILDGYVCRVLESVVNNRVEAFLAVIDRYSASNLLKRIFSHLESTSVQDFLLSFISRVQESGGVLGLAEELRFIEFVQRVCEIPLVEWPREEAVLEEKAYLLGLYCSILQKVNGKLNAKLHPDGESPSLAKPVTPELRELAKVLRKDHLARVVEIAASVATTDQAGSHQMGRIALHYGRLVKLALRAYSLVRGLEARTDGEEQKLVKEMLESCEDCFDPIIPACFAFVFEDYLQAEHPKAFRGRNSLLAKVEFLEILGALSRENIFFARRSIVDHACCGHLLAFMELHPRSSILHNAILAILLPFLAPDCPPLLADKLFRLVPLFAFLFTAVKTDYEARFQRRERSQVCFMAQLSALSQAVERLHIDSPALTQYKQTYEWQFIRECLLEDEHALRKKPLGGHEKLRDRRPLIFFSRQQCLDHYKHFLSGLKLNSFEDFENYEPGNSDSEDEKDRDKDRTTDLSALQEGEVEVAGQEDDSKYFAEDYTL